MIPRTHWHHYIGHPVLVHCMTGTYRGHLVGLSSTHLHLHGYQMASYDEGTESHMTTLNLLPESPVELSYYPGAALALPVVAIVGITALGLGAMGAW